MSKLWKELENHTLFSLLEVILVVAFLLLLDLNMVAAINDYATTKTVWMYSINILYLAFIYF